MTNITNKTTQMFLEAVRKSLNPNLVPKHGLDTLGRPYTRFVNPHNSDESYSVKEFLTYTGEFSFKYKPLIQKRCIKLLNQQLENKDFFNISCAYFKHDLKISTDGRSIALQLEDKKTKNVIARREIKKDINGQTYINNMFLNIENDSYLGIKNTGLGTHLVRKQIETLINIPEVEYIEMDAAGYGKEHVKGKNSVFNGYYVWPCMGFNYRFNSAEIDYLKAGLKREGLMEKVSLIYKERGYLEVFDFVTDKTLKQFWKAYGFELDGARFSLNKEKGSFRVFQNYIKEKEQDSSKIFKTKGAINSMKRKKTADEKYEEMMNLPHEKTKQELKEREAFREILRKKGQSTEIINEIVITPADGIFWELIGKDIDPDRRDAWTKKKKEK